MATKEDQRSAMGWSWPFTLFLPES